MPKTNGQAHKPIRETFATIPTVRDYPDFLDVQLKSFADFVQMHVPPEERESKGLQSVFEEHFPISDSRERYLLEFIEYNLEVPKHTEQECIAQGLSYSVPLKAKMLLSSKEDEDEDEPEDAQEQEVYLGNLPYMTEQGTFIINGAERVVVSQLHRSPGVFFGQSVHPNGTQLFSARVIPFRGSWIEFSTDVSNCMWAYIDRKKKLPVTTLLRALGYSDNEALVRIFDLADEYLVKSAKAFKKAEGRVLATSVSFERITEVVDEDTGEVIEERKEREVILPAGHPLELSDYDVLSEMGVQKIFLVKQEDDDDDALDKTTLLNTIKKDPTNSEEEALNYLYQQLRGTEAPDMETARGVLNRLFFSEKRYDLGEVGRYRLNKRLNLNEDLDKLTLTKEDILAIIRELISLKNGKSSVDDIDHLGNRRVRTVGEQLGSQFSLGLARMARTIKERMNLRDADKFNPQDLVNARTVSSVINTFFGTNQLSQFMDQTNPLAELTHKRRMSALGPGGLTRERAGFEVRDVHYTHYGRLCPIETPEGPNIGLISSLCVHATINDFGFIETPYRVVKNGKVTKEVKFLSAEEEDRAIIAQANAPFDDETGAFENRLVRCRQSGDFPMIEPDDIQYMDIAPNQIVSPAASLIPFLEHDDANRALMGSNMQRQAVPLLRADSPIVGTGLEARAARDSRAVIVSEGAGVVEYADANRVIIRYDQSKDDAELAFEEPIKEYTLTKFRRTNQDTCINQKPIVKKGDRVEKNTVLTEGFSTDNGELALGKNVLVAFMPWRGYNFEDAIILSERMVSDDVYTSVHIEEYDLQVRDTKRGEEELTREIPNVSEEATKDLDERGIIRIGAEVTAGDIIVGKITPKGETDPTPEEKLLRAIFGDKAGDVKDASLKAPPGMKGVVIDTKLFSRRKLDPASKKLEQQRMAEIEEQFEREVGRLTRTFWEKFFNLVDGKPSVGLEDRDGVILVMPDAPYTKDAFKETRPIKLSSSVPYVADKKLNKKVQKLVANYRAMFNRIDGMSKRDKHQVQMGDELPPGIVQLAKVYIAKKRKIQVGDKMAGRHGNKGVIAKIVPQEDMPFLEDGTPVDIVLNPLGVPSRMNLGQIYETLLGWAGSKLGKKFATPIFDGAKLDGIGDLMEEAGLPRDGRAQLYDGHTGEAFDQRTTVGYIYMLKLSHLVQDKMHARSIGPYSLITQQPLGGKAQFGGQRLGEMEVWALYAYGASHVLQEMLTYKSDDVEGRSKAYEAIVKGDNMPEPNTPESFNVLVRELQGLGLEIKLD
ncbi:MAG: DNA-directed RNA polymerase subunit beta [Rhodothermales bacterium]